MSELASAIRRFDVERYCEAHGAELVADHEYLLTCPQCGKEKLTVNSSKASWHCWTCDSGSATPGAQGRGGLIDLMRLLDRVTTREAIQKILLGGRHTNVPLDRIDANLLEHVVDEVRAFPAIAPPQPLQHITSSLPYLEKRGITLDDVRAFGLFVCIGGRYANRLVFPVWEAGNLVYWQARAMWEVHEQRLGTYLKTLNPPRVEGYAVSSDVLMNIDQAARYERVAIVEGPVDCVKAGPSAVCTFGKQISPRQISKLVAAGVQAIDFMWDGPNPREPQGAWPEMRAYAPTLAAFFDVRIVRLPFGDPGERDRREIDQLRAVGEPYEAHNALAYL